MVPYAFIKAYSTVHLRFFELEELLSELEDELSELDEELLELGSSMGVSISIPESDEIEPECELLELDDDSSIGVSIMVGSSTLVSTFVIVVIFIYHWCCSSLNYCMNNTLYTTKPQKKDGQPSSVTVRPLCTGNRKVTPARCVSG